MEAAFPPPPESGGLHAEYLMNEFAKFCSTFEKREKIRSQLSSGALEMLRDKGRKNAILCKGAANRLISAMEEEIRLYSNTRIGRLGHVLGIAVAGGMSKGITLAALKSKSGKDGSVFTDNVLALAIKCGKCDYDVEEINFSRCSLYIV